MSKDKNPRVENNSQPVVVKHSMTKPNTNTTPTSALPKPPAATPTTNSPAAPPTNEN